MKALVLKEYNNFSVEDVPVPEFGRDEVLIRVKACSICGSDVHGMDGSTGRRIPPIIMGHEAAGVIEKVGENVKSYKPGDRVTFDSTVYCGSCYFCRHGEINLCDNRKVLGVSCGDYRFHGAFAEYVAVPQHILYPLSDELSFERAAMVEPLSIAFHAIKRSPVSLNDTAVVVGAGMIGLLIIQLLKVNGCGKIIAVDLVPGKLEMAKKFGATHALKSDEVDVPAEIYKLTSGLGADIAFEAVGIGPTIQTAISSLKKGGSLTLVGNIKPSIDLPLQTVVTRQLSLYGSCASNGEYPDCLDLIASGKVDVDSFISSTSSLEDAAGWFDRLYKGEPGLMKVIIIP
ncbi:MAG TPA: galactitol-1-phosphate 5-dehydrogenase [Ruminiclostridium sp.]|nr:galactitol-1-phosphate 5-dehydrogenase [Ruminiclostridium sp.]